LKHIYTKLQCYENGHNIHVIHLAVFIAHGYSDFNFGVSPPSNIFLGTTVDKRLGSSHMKAILFLYFGSGDW
jgi:hypothetical protein